MPDLPPPDPPAGQVALRAVIESVLADYRTVASFSHHDRFWQSGRKSVYGWGTRIEPRAEGRPIEVWFDGLDNDVAVWTDSRTRRRRKPSVWHEWHDLDGVLTAVADTLRSLLNEYR